MKPMDRNVVPAATVEYDVVCLSHLRWDFVWQRPQHLLGRCARERRVVFFEEPMYGTGPARLESRATGCGVDVVVPHLPEGISTDEAAATQAALLREHLDESEITRYVLWYYTPM